ncbi:MAG: enoyl-CoA hydratase/isomerase family protein [Bdellovibrionales bacterium]|nr:enoyl-CoA hydratase/isomerase family protein [Bdellovibrionales bacterium]
MQISSRRSKSGSSLIIELLKPERLNALDLEAFVSLNDALERAQLDPKIRFVLLWAPPHLNPKAFCAGGDVRRIFEEFERSKNISYGAEFFHKEYLVDQKVWNFSKPIVALTHGITMGGGIGLIRGAPFRVICESSIWAMPEVSIGLYPDVGSSYFLRQLPSAWAAFMAFTGARVGPSDLLELGLATHYCKQEDLAIIVDQLETLEVSEELNHQSLCQLICEKISPTLRLPPYRGWKENEKWIEKLFGFASGSSLAPQVVASKIWSAAQAAASSKDCPVELREALEMISRASPLSLCLTAEQLQQELSLSEAFSWELQASLNCLKSGDFFEGVRSRLIDKDFQKPNKPQWRFKSPSEIPTPALAALFPKRKTG